MDAVEQRPFFCSEICQAYREGWLQLCGLSLTSVVATQILTNIPLKVATSISLMGMVTIIPVLTVLKNFLFFERMHIVLKVIMLPLSLCFPITLSALGVSLFGISLSASDLFSYYACLAVAMFTFIPTILLCIR